MHLGEGDHEGERLLLHVQLEEVPAPDDLKTWQHDPSHVHMGYKNIPGYLLKKVVRIENILFSQQASYKRLLQ